MAVKVDQQLLEVCTRLGADVRHARHVAGLCRQLYDELKHLHGLTKTSAALLEAAAALHDVAAGDGKEGHHLRGRDAILKLRELPLTAPQRRIVADAVALHARRSDVAGHLARAAEAADGAAPGLAARLAAVLRIADGIAVDRVPRTAIAGIRDDGAGVDIYLAAGPHAAAGAAAAGKADLFNALAPRPVRSVAVHAAGEVPSAWVRPEHPAIEAARRVLQRQMEQLLSRRYGLGLAEDIEYVHEMRVAMRRMRAAMRVFRKLVAGGFRRPRDRLKELADVLGAARDGDVFMQFIADRARGAHELHRPFLDSVVRSEKRKRRRHLRRALEVFASAEVEGFLGGLYRTLRAPVGSRGGLRPGKRRAMGPVRRQAPRALQRCLKRLEKFGRRVDRLAPEDLHRLRIECKRMRYTAEFFAEVYPDGLKGLTGTMVKVQDLLGDFHDADVYAERLRQHDRCRRARTTDPGAASALGALVGGLRADQQELLARARRTWMSFTSARTQKRLARQIASPLGS